MNKRSVLEQEMMSMLQSHNLILVCAGTDLHREIVERAETDRLILAVRNPSDGMELWDVSSLRQKMNSDPNFIAQNCRKDLQIRFAAGWLSKTQGLMRLEQSMKRIESASFESEQDYERALKDHLSAMKRLNDNDLAALKYNEAVCRTYESLLRSLEAGRGKSQHTDTQAA